MGNGQNARGQCGTSTRFESHYRHNIESRNQELYTKMILGLFNEFARGIRKKSNAGITNTLEDAHKTTAAVIYGDVAFRTRSNLIINKSTMGFEYNNEAVALLKRAYRYPYVHPYV